MFQRMDELLHDLGHRLEDRVVVDRGEESGERDEALKSLLGKILLRPLHNVLLSSHLGVLRQSVHLVDEYFQPVVVFLIQGELHSCTRMVLGVSPC